MKDAALLLGPSGKSRDWWEDRIGGIWAEYCFGADAKVARTDALVPVFLSIRDREGRLVRLMPNPAQQQYARGRSERNIILKARQVGMTTYIAARFFFATIRQPGTVTLQVAHSLESAQQIFRIVHRFAHYLDPDVKQALRMKPANVRELAFGAVDSRYIVDTAGNPNAGRGLTVHNLHASEVALWPGRPQETMAALLAAVVRGGAVEIESTPHGLGGYFHSEWLRARAGEGFTPHFFPWWIEPCYRLSFSPWESLEPLSEPERALVEQEHLRPEQIKFRRYLRTTFGDLATQEFAETDTDCFLVSGRPVFDLAVIEARLRSLPPPRGSYQTGAEVVWLEPEAGRDYVIGADVAEGGERGDFSAAVILDMQTGLQCAEVLARWPIERFAQELARLGERYNHALIAVERNNQGHAVLYALRHQFGYACLYHHSDSSGNQAGGAASASTDGWPTNAQTKPQAIGELTKMLRDAPGAFASKRLLEQCRSFCHSEGGRMGARPGTHDDLVMAMAIALAVRAQAGSAQWMAARL